MSIVEGSIYDWYYIKDIFANQTVLKLGIYDQEDGHIIIPSFSNA